LKVIALAYQLASEAGASVRSSPVSDHADYKGRPENANYFNPVGDVGTDDGWITPDNIQDFTLSYYGIGDAPKENHIPVAIMTADFAMQNVILQMNLPLVTIEGLQVRSLQKWTKRCYACETITKNIEEVFCSICGHMTLEKISYTINADGSTHYNIPRKSRSLKGTIYPIPRPKGGRNNNDLILRPDQYPKYLTKPKKTTNSKAYNEFDDYDSFGTRKAPRPTPVVGYGNKNPNQSRRKIGKKNKSKLRGF